MNLHFPHLASALCGRDHHHHPRSIVLVPLFAIGVFVGFTLSQFGMVLHWTRERPAGWQGRVVLNGFARNAP